MPFLMLAEEHEMRTTVAIDDELIAQAREYTGLTENAALIREALKTLVAVEAGRRLARLGGTDPNAKAPPRRRPKLR
jgi:Arc/MetJ family transcription regulator